MCVVRAQPSRQRAGRSRDRPIHRRRGMTAPIVTSDLETIKIYFDGALHLRLNRYKLLGIQSWRESTNSYWIEYTMEGGVVLCGYDKVEKFTSILKQLDELL